jgi:hypothetical protein
MPIKSIISEKRRQKDPTPRLTLARGSFMEYDTRLVVILPPYVTSGPDFL